MSTYVSALRVARAEVAPQIPTLAEQLADDPMTVIRAVEASVARQGFDPAALAPVNVNKSARHAISGWAIREQCQILTKGEGCDAQFLPVDGVRKLDSGLPGGPALFGGDVLRLLDYGALQTKRAYSEGDDPEHRCWQAIEDHYKALGNTALALVGGKAIPVEGMSLTAALRTFALEEALLRHATFIRQHDEIPEADRVSAAHDLAFLPEMISAHNFVGSMQRFGYNDVLDARVVRGCSGTYRLDIRNRDEMSAFWRDSEDPPTVTLKCAARVEDSMSAYVHAAIALMPEYGVL